MKPFLPDLQTDPADGWRDPTWFDRVWTRLRRRIAQGPAGDPWSVGFAGFGFAYLALALGGWLAALARGEPRLPAVVGALLLAVLAARFLSVLEARLRPKPMPRIRPAVPARPPDTAFWKALRRSGVNVRIARALYAGGIRGLADVQARSDEELLAIPGVGRRTLARVRAVAAMLQEAP